MDYENIQNYKIKDLDYFLPEWITNFKNYFLKGYEKNYSRS